MVTVLPSECMPPPGYENVPTRGFGISTWLSTIRESVSVNVPQP